MELIGSATSETVGLRLKSVTFFELQGYIQSLMVGFILVSIASTRLNIYIYDNNRPVHPDHTRKTRGVGLGGHNVCFVDSSAAACNVREKDGLS